MKTNLGGVFGLLFILFAFSNIDAQERKVTEQEIVAAGKKWSFKGKAYRLKKETKTIKKADGKVKNFFKSVSEYSASGDYHDISEVGESLENRDRVETFIIGKTVYSQNPSGKWKVYELKAETEEQKARRNAQSAETEKITEHFYRGRTSLNNEEADLYESKTIEKSKRNGREFVSVFIAKRWYSKDGMVLKVEWTHDNELESKYTLFEYELDPDIKIEAPIK